jgi:hypothetical protein
MMRSHPYELVLTGITAFALDVERVDVRDARTQRVLLSLTGPDLLSRMNPSALLQRPSRA